MKQIGIKLADGSFYPIMEDGLSGSKKLGLTTVMDNQTKIVVDLYRSKNGTMEDAEYIDSLQIENLVAHPKVSMDIPLTIKLDENNKLSAELTDPETGAQSSADITLVSRTREERLEPTNYDIKMDENGNFVSAGDDEISDDGIDFSDFEDAEDGEPIVSEGSGFDLDGGTLKEDGQYGNSSDIDSEVDAADENIDSLVQDGEGDFDIPETVDLHDGFPEEYAVDETIEAQNNAAEEKNTETEGVRPGAVAAGVAAGAVGGGLLARMMAKRSDGEEDAAEKTENDSENTEVLSDAMASKADALKGMGENPEYEGPVLESEDSSASEQAESFGFEGNDFSDGTEVSDEDVLSEPQDFSDSDAVSEQDGFTDDAQKNTESSSDGFDDSLDFDLPDFSDSASEEKPLENKDDATVESTPSSDDFFASETLEDPFANRSAGESSDTADGDFTDMDLPDFPEEDSAETSDDEFLRTIASTDQERNETPSYASGVAGAGLDFDDLYDKETRQGESYRREEDSEEDDVKKKTKAPVIICVVCAMICIIAVLLLLLVVPSKYNLLGKRKAEPPLNVFVPLENEEDVEEEVSPPVETEAREDEIVVITEPEVVETVEPEVPPVPEVPKSVTYKIKWGDTLWDIADAYYKNPWRYHRIARYNGIKNPDYIISGTTIELPKE